MHFPEQEKQMLRKQIKDLEDWAIECLKKSEMSCQEGGERKRIMLRVLRFSAGHPCHSPAKIEHGVQGALVTTTVIRRHRSPRHPHSPGETDVHPYISIF